MKIKRFDINTLMNAMHSPKTLKREGIEFTYAIYKNINKLKGVCEALEKTSTKTLKEYNTERIALCEKYCDKDDAGKPVMIDNNYQGCEKSAEFRALVEELRIKHKESFDAVSKCFLEEEEVDLHMIEKANLPKDISLEELLGLHLIITDKIDKKEEVK